MYNATISTINNTMNNFITANDLKTKGISVIEPIAKKGLETVVKVRGVDTYVILTIKEFNRLRECELLEAVAKTENDLACGNYREESVDEHLKRILND